MHDMSLFLLTMLFRSAKGLAGALWLGTGLAGALLLEAGLAGALLVRVGLAVALQVETGLARALEDNGPPFLEGFNEGADWGEM